MFRNRLLRAVPLADLERLSPHLQRVALSVGQEVSRAFQPISHVYFPDSGLLSVVTAPHTSQRVEVGMFGREGASGLARLLGTDRTPFQVFVQTPGLAHRIEGELFAAICDSSRPLQRLMLQFTYVLSIQTAETARSNAKLTVEQRLARWLLMAHDRAEDDEIRLTHDFLSLMLGARRPGVTVAIHVLEGEHLIKARRGILTVRDRHGLMKVAGDSYGLAEAEYGRLIGWPSDDRKAGGEQAGATASRGLGGPQP